jgi:hypothetical protein
MAVHISFGGEEAVEGCQRAPATHLSAAAAVATTISVLTKCTYPVRNMDNALAIFLTVTERHLQSSH